MERIEMLGLLMLVCGLWNPTLYQVILSRDRHL